MYFNLTLALLPFERFNRDYQKVAKAIRYSGKLDYDLRYMVRMPVM